MASSRSVVCVYNCVRGHALLSFLLAELTMEMTSLNERTSEEENSCTSNFSDEGDLNGFLFVC